MTSSEKSKVAALVLDESVSVPSVFPGVVPGVFRPGEPVALADLGLTEKEARELVANVPLVVTRAAVETTEED